MCNRLSSTVFFFFQIEYLKKTINRFYGENPKTLKNLSKIINKHQFDRLRNIIEDPAVAASIVHGGSLDEKNLWYFFPLLQFRVRNYKIIILDFTSEVINFLTSIQKKFTGSSSQQSYWILRLILRSWQKKYLARCFQLLQ